jgi:alkanesulfonate monooxygenase SsuD/methylene tetrahydromethanopterin reductase-like flavin-dependent oxidoreductase (luciferase family)
MIGGGGSKLLKIAGEEADIANVAAPITAGVADFAAMLKFDKAELRRRIGMLRQFATAAGRDPNAIEISGFVTVMPAADKSQSEAIAEGTAKSMGFAGAQAVRDSPMFLVGTPDEIKREIKSRSQELGLTYYVTVFMADEARELFARQVMPEFTRRGASLTVAPTANAASWAAATKSAHNDPAFGRMLPPGRPPRLS